MTTPKQSGDSIIIDALINKTDSIYEAVKEAYPDWDDEKIMQYISTKGDELRACADSNFDDNDSINPIIYYRINIMPLYKCPVCNIDIEDDQMYIKNKKMYHRSCRKELVFPDKETSDNILFNIVNNIIGNNDDFNNDNTVDFLNQFLEEFNYETKIALKNGCIVEASPKSAKERIHRKVRSKKIGPANKDLDRTPVKDSDNDPTQTIDGKRALKKRIRYNKKNRHKFKEATEFLDIIKDKSCDWDNIATMIENFKDCVNTFKFINKCKPVLNDDGFHSKIIESIDNIFSSKIIKIPIGVVSATDKDANINIYNDCKKVCEDISRWHSFTWVERKIVNDMAIFYAIGDTTPSDLYLESKIIDNVNVIPSNNDESNIIQIINGDTNV